jgi:thiosulfate dehydrogenase
MLKSTFKKTFEIAMPYRLILLGMLWVSTLIIFPGLVSAAEDEPPLPATFPFTIPEDEIPDGPLGTVIEYGEDLVMETQTFAKPYVGNGLNCRSCHLGGGTMPNAMPYVGVPSLFPRHKPRSGKVITIQERINGCFRRSLNGKPLELNSPEMTAIVAYMSWLSQGVPAGMEVEGRGTARLAPPASPPNAERGQKLFIEKCAHCHGEEGQGMKGSEGAYVFPPLWGEQSFNIAAGMARLNTAAAFIKHNMPFGQEESLTDQEAYDIASFVTTQPRPDFPDKAKDWPNGGKPKDARY